MSRWPAIFGCVCISTLAAALDSFEQYAIPASLMAAPVLEISRTWDVLGPFQIGTREAAWGADPLEFYGGFSGLKVDSSSSYPSSLTTNGTVGWSKLQAKDAAADNSGAKASLSIAFPDVDWAFLQQIYGWAAKQYQAWVRGEIVLNASSEQNVLLWTPSVIEFAVDGKRYYGGDFFAFKKAPLVLRLSPGRHTLELRLVRDVRAMGGIGNPTIDVQLETALATSGLEVRKDSIVVSDVVDGKLASPYGTVSVTNTADNWLRISGIQSESDALSTQVWSSDDLLIAPGQTRPLPFLLSFKGEAPEAAKISIIYHADNEKDKKSSAKFDFKLRKTSLYSTHKVTHLHPGGIVSYAMLRPPAQNATCPQDRRTAPVFLLLHGAGVEADGLVAVALDPLPNLCAWALFPTGVTSWSSDDWHTWGFADVEAAVSSIKNWIKTVEWKGLDADINKWLVAGHSNGGQGTWYALAHRPDKIFAAAPMSGYLSIQTYVPFQLWRPIDPRKKAVLDSAIASYRHELLASNFNGIPIFQQHGSLDDNVPTYHSRQMHQLVSETGWSTNYSEIAGQGHWWEDVATTPGLKEFYQQALRKPLSTPVEDISTFEIVVANPADTDSKFGIRVMYLHDPGQLGRLRVTLIKETGVWVLEPENVMALEFDATASYEKIAIQGSEDTAIKVIENPKGKERVFMKQNDGSFAMTNTIDTRVRKSTQFGGLHAILGTAGRFAITYNGDDTFGVALQISRNLHQYFFADAEIVKPGVLRKGTGNIITVAVGPELPANVNKDFPIRLSPKGRLQVQNPEGSWETPGGSKAPIGAVFVRPYDDQRLELVVWGSTLSSLQQAARLVPTTTGIGQPDFIIIQENGRWKGADAAYLGFFNAWWKVSKSSVLPI